MYEYSRSLRIDTSSKIDSLQQLGKYLNVSMKHDIKEEYVDIVVESFDLTENFIESYLIPHEKRHITLFNDISAFQEISEKFISKYKDKICWFSVCEYQKLSADFIMEHIEYIKDHFYSLSINNKIDWNELKEKGVDVALSLIKDENKYYDEW